MVTITTTRSIPDDRVAEARRDLDLLNNPQNLITYKDGYYSRSLVQKWGMQPSELAALVKAARRQKKPPRE